MDEVRIRWIRSMAQGMRTTTKNRAAVQDFRGRARRIWGEPEKNFSIFGSRDIEDEERSKSDENLAEIALLNLALLQAEANDQRGTISHFK